MIERSVNLRSVLRYLACLLAALILFGCEDRTIGFRSNRIPIISETVGTGRLAEPGKAVTIAYTVTRPDGEVILTARDYRFTLSGGGVITGVNDAVEGMRVGGRRVVRCPPEKHWGRAGYADGKIPPNTILTIDVQLLRVE